MPSDLSNKVARGSLSGLVRYVVALPITFFITPYILKTLGPDQFGIWALVGVLGTFIQLSDFGVGVTLVKYVAEINAVGDTAQLNAMISTAAVLYLILTTVVVVPLILFRVPIVENVFAAFFTGIDGQIDSY